MGRPFVFLSSPPIYGGFAYLAPTRWLLGVDFQPPQPRIISRKPPEPHGTLRGCKMAEIRLGSGIFGFLARSLVFFCRHAVCGGFAYLAAPRLVLGFNVYLPRKGARCPTEPLGTLRNGNMAEIRLGSGILGIPGPVFGFHLSPPHMRRFRVFSAPAFGVGC